VAAEHQERKHKEQRNRDDKPQQAPAASWAWEGQLAIKACWPKESDAAGYQARWRFKKQCLLPCEDSN
jgi:hypothetical protein